jgi:putative transcriptional regulator
MARRMGRRRSEVWMDVREGGKPLKRKRQRAELTQRELAFLVGKTDTTIYMLETGRLRSCSEQLAHAITKRLACDLEDLFIERTASVAAPPATVSRAVSTA